MCEAGHTWGEARSATGHGPVSVSFPQAVHPAGNSPSHTEKPGVSRGCAGRGRRRGRRRRAWRAALRIATSPATSAEAAGIKKGTGRASSAPHRNWAEAFNGGALRPNDRVRPEMCMRDSLAVGNRCPLRAGARCFCLSSRWTWHRPPRRKRALLRQRRHHCGYLPPSENQRLRSVAWVCSAGTLPTRDSGSAQKFCCTGHRQEFWMAARRWTMRAIDAGLYSQSIA